MLTIHNLALKSNKQTILDVKDLTLDFQKKYLLLGENSSGKSLFLNTLHINKGKNIAFTNLNEAKNRRLTILIEQKINLLENLSVWKNLQMGIPKINKEIKSSLTNLCKQVELTGYFNEKTCKLSFSNQKLIELIRAIVIAPALLLIDDFDKYFDDIVGIEAIALLALAVSRGVIVLCTSSQTQIGFDETLVIQDGKILVQ